MDFRDNIMLIRKKNVHFPSDGGQERAWRCQPLYRGSKKIADALEVSLDYFVGKGVNSKFDKLTLKSIEEAQHLYEVKKHTIF